MRSNDVHAACAILIALAAFSCGGGGPAAPAEINGPWEGLISVQGIEMEIDVNFTGSPDSPAGTIDIPVQGAFGLALTGVSVEGDSVSFDLPSGLGMARFRGVASPDSISGSFTQGSATGSFVLHRPAVLDADLPYETEEIELAVNGTTLGGTLTTPPGDGPFPGLVLITGSGIQDRDETVMGFAVFGVLADSLTRNGVAVLRCDDRGFGGVPGGDPLASDSILVEDASALLARLEDDPRVDDTLTGFLGHSEGATIALRAASAPGSRADFVICLAGPAVPGYDVLLDQVEDFSRLEGEPEETVAERVAMQRAIMDAVLAGEEGAAALDSLLEAQARSDYEALPDSLTEAGSVEEYVTAIKANSMMLLRSAWFSEFLLLDPASFAAECPCPVLAVYGSLDMQVNDGTNAPVMTRALSGKPGSSVEVLEGANHLFQAAVTGGFEEYSTLPRRFVPGLIPLVMDFIQSRD